MLAGVFFFSIVDATAKWLGQSYAPVQIVFFQHFFGLIPVAVLVWRSGGLSSLRTRRPLVHALRGSLLFASMLLFFTALRGLPLAEAIAVTFTLPLFITALSGPLLGEAVGVRRWAAVIIGFMGALIMVRPGTDAFRPEALLVLTSAFIAALAMLLTRRLTRTETDVALVTYTTVIGGLASLPFLVLAWQAPSPGDLGLFALVGIGGGSGAYLLVVAFRNARSGSAAIRRPSMALAPRGTKAERFHDPPSDGARSERLAIATLPLRNIHWNNGISSDTTRRRRDEVFR